MTTINVTPVVNNEAITIRSTGPVAVLTRTSTSTHTIETGSKTFTFSPTNSIGWTIGQRLRAANTVDNWMEGAITSITTSTVVILVDAISGSGSLSSWNIGLSGQKGADGSPDTAAQIVTKLESIAVEEEKPEKTVIKNFITEVDGRINTIVYPPDDDQMFLNGGKITIGTLFKKITSNFPTVTTEFSKIHGSRNAPQYHFLSLPASLTTAQKQWLNKVKVVHSGLVVPSVLVPNKPTSPLAVYADQAAMLADQASQVTGEYYEYTGSTSMWQKTAASTGAIGDYTELVALAGWETWGTKPSYLIVQGDAYLTGQNNVNELDFVYHELIKIDSVSYADVVVVTNTAHTGMNADIEKAKINQIIVNNFNENEDPITETPFINESLYGNEFQVTLNNPTLGQYVDLTGGNYAFDFGQSRFFGGRAHTIMNISENTLRILQATQRRTVICRTAFRFEESTQDRAIFNNITDTGSPTVNGFKFEYREDVGQLKLTWATEANTILSLSSDEVSPINAITNGGQYVFACRFWLDDVTTRVRFYVKSLANAIGWQQYGTERTVNSSVPRLGHDVAYYDRSIAAATSTRPETRDYLQVRVDLLDEASLEAIANEID